MSTTSLPPGLTALDLFEASPDGLLIVDPDGTVLAVNDNLVNLLGHAREDLVGRSVDQLVPPAVRKRHRDHRTGFGHAPVVRGMATGLELHALTGSGELLPVDIMLGPLPGAGEGCVLAAVRDVRQRKEREEGWEHRALHDPLTGVANRSLVLDRIRQGWKRSERGGGRVLVFFLDLDGFKEINDRMGHAAGDQVLVVTAQRLSAATRPSDTVGRLGGDEFVVVVEDDVSERLPQGHAERLRDAVARPMSVGDTELAVGCSVGVATSEDVCDWPELLSLADRRMYEDKALRTRVPRPRPVASG